MTTPGSSIRPIISKGDHADRSVGELQFVSRTTEQGLGKVSFKHDATSTERFLKFSVDSNEVLINNKGYVGIGTAAPTAELEVKGKISNYGEAGYPSRFTSLALNTSSAASQYVDNDDIAFHNISGTTTLTLEAWVYTVDTQDYQYILMKGNQGWGMFLKNSDKSIGFNGISSSYDAASQPTSNANAYVLNVWQHIAVAVNTSNDTIKFYVNGINVGTSTGNNVRIIDDWNTGNQARILVIGKHGPQDIQHFRGYIADVRIWTAELSQATIQEWMKKDLTGSHPNTATLNGRAWRFNMHYRSVSNNMRMVGRNSAILVGFSWTDASKSGRVELKELHVQGDARLSGNVIFDGYVGINQSSVNPSYNFIVNNSMYCYSITAGVVTTFTGAHLSITKEQHENINDDTLKNDVTGYENKIGYIVRSTGKYYNCTKDVEKEKPTIYESLSVIEFTKTEKDPACWGVIAKMIYEEGINRFIINSLGEGAIIASNYNGNITNGLYITSSPLEGIGMKQDSDSLKNYTVAKATQDEDFTTDYQEITHTNGQTYRYKLIGCTYHCG